MISDWLAHILVYLLCFAGCGVLIWGRQSERLWLLALGGMGWMFLLSGLVGVFQVLTEPNFNLVSGGTRFLVPVFAALFNMGGFTVWLPFSLLVESMSGLFYDPSTRLALWDLLLLAQMAAVGWGLAIIWKRAGKWRWWWVGGVSLLLLVNAHLNTTEAELAGGYLLSQMVGLMR